MKTFNFNMSKILRTGCPQKAGCQERTLWCWCVSRSRYLTLTSWRELDINMRNEPIVLGCCACCRRPSQCRNLAKHVFLVVLSLIMTVKDIASSTNILPTSMMWVKRATDETRDFSLLPDSLLPDAFEQNQNENVHLSSTVILLNHLLSWSNRLQMLAQDRIMSWTYYSWWNSQILAVNHANSRCACFNPPTSPWCHVNWKCTVLQTCRIWRGETVLVISQFCHASHLLLLPTQGRPWSSPNWSMPARNVTQQRTTSRNDFCRDRPLAKLLKRRTLAVDATCTMRNGWLRERLPAVRTYSQLVCVTNAIFLCMYVGIQP